MSKEKPQKDLSQLGAADLLSDHADIEALLDDYVYLDMKIAQQYFSLFKLLSQHLPTHLTDENIEQLCHETQVIPLPALHKNESRYSDVLDIMRYCVEFLLRVYSKAGQASLPNGHIAGDLLTHVMDSGSKLLMIKAPSSGEQFDCSSESHICRILSHGHEATGCDYEAFVGYK